MKCTSSIRFLLTIIIFSALFLSNIENLYATYTLDADITEYRAVVFYPNGTQKVFEDVLIINSNDSYGFNLSYKNTSIYIPSSGKYTFMLKPEPFNISVFIKPTEDKIAFIIQNNYSQTLNVNLEMENTVANPVCGDFCTDAVYVNETILANFSIPSNSFGKLYLADVRSIGSSYMKFHLYSDAIVNRTVPINVVVEKSSPDNVTWYVKFHIKNLGAVDAYTKIRAWYEIDGENHVLYNGSVLIPAGDSWRTTKIVRSNKVPVFYVSGDALNTSKTLIKIIPAYPDNVTNPRSYIYGEAKVLSNITELKNIRVLTFRITPTTLKRYETTNFIIDVENTGYLQVDIQPEIEIYANGILQRKINLIPKVIMPGENITIMSNYIVDLPVGSYEVVLKVYYDNRTKVSSAKSTIEVLPPEIEGEAVTFEEIRETEHIKFALFPALIEVRPGEVHVVSFEIENPTNEDVENLRLSLKGLPEEWVTYETEEISLKGKQSLGLDLIIEVPLSALPGDYKAVMILNNTIEEAKVFFILRIKPYPPKLEKPAVLRNVYLNKKEEKSLVKVFVENTGIEADLIEVVEEIPKEIAQNVRYITFKTPVDILEEDPVVLWRIRDADPFDVYILDYEVHRLSDRYDPYVYWPIKQVNILYEKITALRKIRFHGISAAYAYPGEEFEIKFRVVNPSPEALNLTFTVLTPERWEIVPEEVTKLLLPGFTEEITFRIAPSQDTPPGTYTIFIRAVLGDDEVSQPMTIVILEKRNILKKHYKKLIAALLIISLTYLSIFIYKRRKIYRREIVDAVKKIREKMEEE